MAKLIHKTNQEFSVRIPAWQNDGWEGYWRRKSVERLLHRRIFRRAAKLGDYLNNINEYNNNNGFDY